MRFIKYLYLFIIPILIISCDQTTTEPVVGSTQDTQISNLSFNVDTTYLEASASRIVAKGSVTNNGSAQVTSPWYIEGQFYTDATYKIKLGGNSTQIGVPLSRGQSTFWTIYYTSSNENVNNYPNCRIGDLRGIYK